MFKRDVVVVVIGAVAVIILFFYIQGKVQQASQPRLSFVIAAKEIKTGQELSADNLALSAPTLDKLNTAELYMQIEDAVGTTAVKDIPKGAYINRKEVKSPAVTPPTQENPVPEALQSLPIPDGMRSLTLGTAELEGLPPSLKVGNYLDLFGYESNELSGQRESKTLVRGVLVIGIEHPDKENPEFTKTISVALSPNNAEIVSRALALGKLRLLISEKAAQTTRTGAQYIEIIKGVERQPLPKVSAGRPLEPQYTQKGAEQ